MSTPSIKATLDRLSAAFASHDLDTALSTMSPSVVWDISGPPEIPYAGVFHGHDGYSKFWWLLSATVSFESAGVHTTLYGENKAIALGGEAGRVLANGRPYHYDWAVEYVFGPDAKIVSMRQYYDPSRIVVALSGAHGLSTDAAGSKQAKT
jgi:ketosteroid isomerase-like protein